MIKMDQTTGTKSGIQIGQEAIRDTAMTHARGTEVDTYNARVTRGQIDEASLKSRIPGWGADLELEKRPGYWDTQSRLESGIRFNNIEQQVPHVKINKSIERPTITPVFGTVNPPRLVSGLMRNYAYAKHSEGMIRHWLWLMAADRVDMVEHLITDALQGKLPNLYKEMGLASEWKYNRENFVKKLAVGGVGVLALTAAALLLKDARTKSAAPKVSRRKSAARTARA
jgi:hypothetical protein